jgi:hypothetical protein
MSDLEVVLRDLGERAVFPGEAALAERVVTRLAAEQAEPSTRRWWRTVGLAAAAVLLAVALTVALSPGVRRAVADFLGIGAVRIHPADPATISSVVGHAPVPSAADAALGRSVASVVEAREATGLELPLPEALGPPDAVFVRRNVAGDVVTLRWAPSPSLPSTADPRAGALLTVVRATVDDGLLDKVLGRNTTYERVSVGGEPGLVLSGGSHVVALRAPDGSVIEDTARLAGTTLLWTVGDVTYRLEAELDRDALVVIAESIS